MTNAQTTPASSANAPETPRRQTRVLIGWLSTEEGALWLAGRNTSHITQDYRDQVQNARAVVAARAQGCDQTGLVSDCPPDLDDHVTAFRANPQSAATLAQGFELKMVDLTRVIAVQPHIFTEHAVSRVADADPSDIRTLASVSVPIPTAVPLQPQFDTGRQVWIFSSPNPNLRVMGQFSGGTDTGFLAVGFLVGVPQSFVKVAFYQGKYILTDGYHRAYGFLKSGIDRVPCLVHTATNFSDLGLPPGLLSQDEYLGPRPPVLPDYLDAAVSAPSEMAAQQKTVVVQALELLSFD